MLASYADLRPFSRKLKRAALLTLFQKLAPGGGLTLVLGFQDERRFERIRCAVEQKARAGIV
jgi:hypothetical protein